MKYTEENERIIDSWKEKYGLPWMEPISHKDFLRAANHEELLTLTPLRKVPFSWYGSCKGKRVLGLASGGGQQMAILSALGAECTLFDISDRQIERALSDHADQRRHDRTAPLCGQQLRFRRQPCF